MKLTPAEQLTVKTYNTNAAAWAKKHSTPAYWAEEMATFKKFLPGGKILEIGGGGGRDAQELIKLGYDYVGIDVAEQLLAEAQKLNPNATLLNQSVYDLDFLPNSFDGFWTSATLLHIPKSRIKTALGKIHTVIKSGGIGFISIKQGKGERLDRRRLFAYYSQDEFRKILEDNSYQVIESHIKPIFVKASK